MFAREQRVSTDVATSLVPLSRSQPPVRGPRYIFVKIFKCAMHRPKTDTRAPCLLSDPIAIGRTVTFPSQANFSFVWDGKPRRFTAARFLENESPVSLDRYIARLLYYAFVFLCLHVLSLNARICVAHLHSKLYIPLHWLTLPWLTYIELNYLA